MPQRALPTRATHAMVADAGDVPRPPPLLLRPLHWPMPPLALPPLESHGGWGGGSVPVSAARRCAAHGHYHNLSAQLKAHNEVAQRALRPYM